VALPTDGTPRLVFYGVLCHDTSEVVDLQLSLADAERALAEILADEPEWRNRIEVVSVDFTGPAVIEPVRRQPADP
jgi:hypothetical protein